MERNWDSLLSCFFPLLCYENRELWEARVRQRQEERNVLESRVWQQTERERERESHQTDGTEERLTRYLGQRNIDWRRSSDLVWGNDVIILSSCPLECSIICVIWPLSGWGRAWCLDSALSSCVILSAIIRARYWAVTIWARHHHKHNPVQRGVVCNLNCFELFSKDNSFLFLMYSLL